MRRFFILCLMLGISVFSSLVFGIFWEISAEARGSDNKKFGLGVNLGEPIGMDARYYFLKNFSADLIVGYGFDEHAFIIQPSVLVNFRDVLDYDGQDFSVVPYFGVGLKTGVTRSSQGVAAMRFPLGATWVIKDGTFEISAEFAPGVEFNPVNEFDATGGLGLRYYFF